MRGYGGFGAARSALPVTMQKSASADALFVGPAIQRAIQQPRVESPMALPTIVAPRSAPIASRSYSPPAEMGLDPCGGVVCPPGLTCVNGACIDTSCIGVVCPGNAPCANGACPPPTTLLQPAPLPRPDVTMRAPREPVFTMNLTAPSRTGSQLMPAPSPVPAPVAQPTANPYRAPSGGGGGGGNSVAPVDEPTFMVDDDQRQIPADPALRPAPSAGGGGGLAIAAIAAYFLFF